MRLLWSFRGRRLKSFKSISRRRSLRMIKVPSLVSLATIRSPMAGMDYADPRKKTGVCGKIIMVSALTALCILMLKQSPNFNTPSQEEYRAKQGCTDSDSSLLEFDAALWKGLVGETTKGYVYGVARSHVSGGHMSQSTVNSVFKNDDISKVVDDGRASIMKIEENACKKEEEREEG